jgi:hypothetical protein
MYKKRTSHLKSIISTITNDTAISIPTTNHPSTIKMLLVNLAALLALVASTQAFAIPEGTTNGVYAVTRDADGNDVHTRVAFADAAIEARDPGHELESRSKGEKWCGAYDRYSHTRYEH